MTLKELAAAANHTLEKFPAFADAEVKGLFENDEGREVYMRLDEEAHNRPQPHGMMLRPCQRGEYTWVEIEMKR